MVLPDSIKGWSFIKATTLLYFMMNEEDGEVSYSRDRLAQDLRISTQVLRSTLAKLEAEGLIKNFTNKHGSKVVLTNQQPTSNQPITNTIGDSQLVTVCSNQPATNQQPTSNQPNPFPPPSLSPTTSITSTTLPTNNPPKKEISKEIQKKPSLQERQSKFYDSLIPFVEEYGKDMVRAFYDYWSEPSQGGQKFRKEMERTWDTARRLRTWRSREAKPVGRPIDTGVVITDTENNNYEPW